MDHILCCNNFFFSASEKAVNWFKEKFQANLLTAVFRSSAKDICRDYVATCKLGPNNFSEQAKTSVARWGKNMVEADLAQICASNADLIVKELKQEIEFIVPEAGEIQSGDTKKMVEHALVLMQSQIAEMKKDAGPACIDLTMESLVIKAIFENPKTAATKTLELLKIWSELRPEKKEVLEIAAKNILNFQGTKAYLTLLDFDTALFRILTEASQVAFRTLKEELQTAMNKPAQEIKMDKSE